jgi:hypothetical protein
LPEILPPSYDAANKLPPPVTQPIIPGNPWNFKYKTY